jgi:hypothetical protein
MIILPMCPLTRLFVPEYQKDLMKNPSSIWEEVPFVFQVSTSRKDYKFSSSKPEYITDTVLSLWLLGGDDGMQCQETNWTGLVKIDLDSVQNGAVLAAVTGVSKIDSNVQDAIEDAKKRAALLSKERVMREIRKVNSAMTKQYEYNRQDNKGLYTPSITEYLCAYVLAEEKKKDIADKQELSQAFADLMAKTFA